MKLSRKSRVIIFLHIKDEKELLNLTKCIIGAIEGNVMEIGLLTNLIKRKGQNFFVKMLISKSKENEESELIIDGKPMTLLLSELDLRIILAELETFANPKKTFKSKLPEIKLKNSKVTFCMNYKDMFTEESV